MFLTLPLEVILHIARELNHRDRLQLATTCSKLRQIMLHNCLHEKVSIGDLSQAYEYKEGEGEFNGRQVKHLTVNLSDFFDEGYMELSTIFPRVTDIFNFGTAEEIRPDAVIESLAKWKDTLQTYDIHENFELILKTMEKYTFSRLSTMVIAPFSYYRKKSVGFSVQMFDCIKNAPSLKDLTLYSCQINMDFMERLHSSCPNLMSLHFDCTTFFMTGESLPDTIESADNIKHLDFKSSTLISDRRGVFMDYIISKYKQLLSFTFHSRFDKYLFKHLYRNYTIGSLSDFLLQNTTVQMVEDDLRDTGSLYKLKGGERLLSRLPRTCKSIDIEPEAFDKMLEALDKSEMNIEKLQIIDAKGTEDILEERLDYLQKWNSLTSLELMIDENGYFSNIQFSNIKNLKLKIHDFFEEDFFYLDQVLTAFPGLKKLNIESTATSLTSLAKKESDVLPYPSLSSVEIKAPSSHPAVLKYLLWANPNIKRLGWFVGRKTTKSPEVLLPVNEKEAKKYLYYSSDYMTKSNQITYCINLTGHRLNTFILNMEFNGSGQDNSCYIHLEVIIAKDVHHYKFRRDDFVPISRLSKLDKIESRKLESATRITIICDELKWLELGSEQTISF